MYKVNFIIFSSQHYFKKLFEVEESFVTCLQSGIGLYIFVADKTKKESRKMDWQPDPPDDPMPPSQPEFPPPDDNYSSPAPSLTIGKVLELLPRKKTGC